MKLIALLIVSLALLVACSEKKAEQTVLDPQVQALKKARETQATVDAGADKTRQAVEAQEEKQIQGY